MFDSFSDIVLDIPHAHTLLETFTDMCARDGIIPISFTMKVPSRCVYNTTRILSPLSLYKFGFGVLELL